MKAKITSATLLCILFLGLLNFSGVDAQSSTNYDLSWNVISSGGGAMASGSYMLQGTLGQVVAGDAQSQNYMLDSQGYWFAPEMHIVFIPIVIRNWG
jgi:hypothetical protein